MKDLEERVSPTASHGERERFLEEAMELVDAYREGDRRERDRQWVRETCSCPTCKADIGHRCRGRKYLLQRNHPARTDLALNWHQR